MSEIADTLDQVAADTREHTAHDLAGVLGKIAERASIQALDAAIEAARSVEHGASPAREAAQLKAVASRASETTDDIASRTDKV